jgi:hypothetical protein
MGVEPSNGGGHQTGPGVVTTGANAKFWTSVALRGQRQLDASEFVCVNARAAAG